MLPSSCLTLLLDFGFFFFFFVVVVVVVVVVSHRLGIWVNSLQLVSEPRVRFKWEQWQRK